MSDILEDTSSGKSTSGLQRLRKIIEREFDEYASVKSIAGFASMSSNKYDADSTEGMVLNNVYVKAAVPGTNYEKQIKVTYEYPEDGTHSEDKEKRFHYDGHTKEELYEVIPTKQLALLMDEVPILAHQANMLLKKKQSTVGVVDTISSKGISRTTSIVGIILAVAVLLVLGIFRMGNLLAVAGVAIMGISVLFALRYVKASKPKEETAPESDDKSLDLLVQKSYDGKTWIFNHDEIRKELFRRCDCEKQFRDHLAEVLSKSKYNFHREIQACNYYVNTRCVDAMGRLNSPSEPQLFLLSELTLTVNKGLYNEHEKTKLFITSQNSGGVPYDGYSLV